MTAAHEEFRCVRRCAEVFLTGAASSVPADCSALLVRVVFRNPDVVVRQEALWSSLCNDLAPLRSF